MDTGKPPEFFYQIFDASLPRLGVGDEASTIRALRALLAPTPERKDGVAEPTRILDIGCGNGAQTVVLAQHTAGSILAVDNHQPFLDELQRRATAAGVAGRIQVALRDMRTLTKDEGPFDLIWSEGAIFITGFCEGLAAWHPLLAPSGGLAISELAWLRSDPPAECEQFFANVYPAMTSIAANLATIESCGYEIIGHFAQPESAWWEPFYHPLEQRLRSLRQRCATDPEKLSMIDSIQTEIEMRRKYSAFYNNVFYMMRRR